MRFAFERRTKSLKEKKQTGGSTWQIFIAMDLSPGRGKIVGNHRARTISIDIAARDGEGRRRGGGWEDGIDSLRRFWIAGRKFQRVSIISFTRDSAARRGGGGQGGGRKREVRSRYPFWQSSRAVNGGRVARPPRPPSPSPRHAGPIINRGGAIMPRRMRVCAALALFDVGGPCCSAESAACRSPPSLSLSLSLSLSGSLRMAAACFSFRVCKCIRLSGAGLCSRCTGTCNHLHVYTRGA